MINLGPVEAMVVLLIVSTLVIWPTWRICSKAGFPGALSLLILLPVLNFFLLYFLAFAEWPSLRLRKEEPTRVI